jgi:hypothetical protein
MYIKVFNKRFDVLMWSDSRLVNTSANFCLCSSCAKSDITVGIICPKHDEFMNLTQNLKLAAPVFACLDFEELPNVHNYLDQYYDNEMLCSYAPFTKMYEEQDRIRRQWEAQQERWLVPAPEG